MSRDPAFSVHTFSAASRPDLLLACQRLRYAVYHHDLGLDTPDMDHAAAIDVEPGDLHSDFFAVTDAAGEVVGTMRVQLAGDAPLYAEQEFVLDDPFWRAEPAVEGARFAVTAPHRNGVVPMLLFGAFRRYCRERGVARLISVAIIPEPEARLSVALGALRWLGGRVRFDLDRARPAPGYEHPGLRPEDAAEATEIDPSTLPPMLKMLAIDRTTLCSTPGFCRRFRSWNFLFVTRLGART